ncbi:TOBE domain-containing protein [Desulfonatronum sp. SC1]|uniref:TOBE domain-containing protein n=1 Tax=Desulfonatronum sp. SC1 TaxID=2109626 RepID=UPI000D2FAE5D|nr:TOBE domain-containing protein [Desulfonatronum sp. SC1]PTN37865.1 integrase [Desulfonatronum sp. SC1]
MHSIPDESVAARRPIGVAFFVPPTAKVLDSVQLAELERTFRAWATDSPRRDVRVSRQRILLIFLLIRHTGAKLNEILDLKAGDIDLENLVVTVGGEERERARAVEIPDDLAEELRAALEKGGHGPDEALFRIDPAHVRRKFYEQAEACGLPREFGNPSTLRRSRSVELLRGNVPLPVVQRLLGHSTPNLTAAHLDVSEEDVHHAARQYVDRESRRRTSARNIFFGKISEIVTGDIQSEVTLLTLGGLRVVSVITNASLRRMRLRKGMFATAEIKAPWVLVAGSEATDQSSAENRLPATVIDVGTGRINAEILLRLADGTEICSITTAASSRRLKLRSGDQAWVLFGAYCVVLNRE